MSEKKKYSIKFCVSVKDLDIGKEEAKNLCFDVFAEDIDDAASKFRDTIQNALNVSGCVPWNGSWSS